MAGAAQKREIGEEELKQRVAVLKRFRELLLDQRKRFGEYLDVLDRQKAVIETGDSDALVQHVELEEKLVADIFAIQKVVEPLELMYRDMQLASPAGVHSPASGPDGADAEIPSLKDTLDDLKAEVVKRSERNRALLGEHIEQLRQEIKTLRNNPFAVRKSIYSGSSTPSLIDIKG